MAGHNCMSKPDSPRTSDRWSPSPQYGVFELAGEEIKTCIALTSNAIVIASWLASMARRELTRFREFIKWLSFGNDCFQKASHFP